jgi:glutathione S-transferase
MNQGRAMRFMAFLNDELATRDFIAGQTYSIADITGLVTCQFLKPARLSIPEEFSALQEWFERVKARPSAAFD